MCSTVWELVYAPLAYLSIIFSFFFHHVIKWEAKKKFHLILFPVDPIEFELIQPRTPKIRFLFESLCVCVCVPAWLFSTFFSYSSHFSILFYCLFMHINWQQTKSHSFAFFSLLTFVSALRMNRIPSHKDKFNK